MYKNDDVSEAVNCCRQLKEMLDQDAEEIHAHLGGELYDAYRDETASEQKHLDSIIKKLNRIREEKRWQAR